MAKLLKILIGAVPVIAVLVAAAFLTPPDFPLLTRQILLFVWGIGGMVVAERVLFGPDWGRVRATLGFVSPRRRTVVVAAPARDHDRDDRRRHRGDCHHDQQSDPRPARKRALAPRVLALLGRLNLARRCRSAGLFRHRRAMVATLLTPPL